MHIRTTRQRLAGTPRRPWTSAALGAIGIAITLSLPAQAPSGGSYVMRKQVIAAGGTTASGGSYVLAGTVGQNVVGVVGASTAIEQGFHTRASQPDELFQNGFE